jgi:hypothetical protein
METLRYLIRFAAARACFYRAAVASLAVGLIVPGAYAHTADDPFVTDLIAGGGNPASAIDVGDVLVWNDGEQLFVRYHVTAQDWCLTETHSHVATSADAIPQTKKGNPIPGKFDFSATLDCVASLTFVVPLTWGPGVELFIATHASLENRSVVYSNGPWTETAWGAGFDFPGRNWATYFTYTVQEPTASLGDFVWEDLDADGIQEAGEPGIPGVEVQLIDANGVVVATTTTDANGSYEFNNLGSGMAYTISFINPDPDGPDAYRFSPRQVGADPALDSDGPVSDSVILGADEFNDTLDAGLFRNGSIHVSGFLDTDGDGILDPGEGPFPDDPGKTFELLDENGNVIATATTFNGMVWFEQLPPGTYTVRENPIPDGFGLSTLPNERTFTLISGEELVYEDGAAMLPAGDRRFETNVGDELRWGNTETGSLGETVGRI